jgi:drug/metabolite transporter (DMT)-like permease
MVALAMTTRIALAFAAVSIIWGSTYLGIRLALEGFPPFLLGAIRFIVAGLLLFAFARRRGEPAPSRREWLSALIAGTLFFAIGNGFVGLAERSVSSGIAAVLVATMPLWTTIVFWMAGQSVSRGEAVGIALGLLGVGVMQIGGQLRASPAGAAFCLIATIGWALGSLASRRLPLPVGFMRAAASMLAGGAVMLAISFARGEHTAVVISPRAVVAVAYLTLVGSLLGFTAYSYLLAHARTTLATSYTYVNPVIALALGGMFAGERFDVASMAGAAVVVGAVALVSAGARGPSRSTSS